MRTERPDAAVQTLPSVPLVCGRSIAHLDDTATLVPLADSLSHWRETLALYEPRGRRRGGQHHRA